MRIEYVIKLRENKRLAKLTSQKLSALIVKRKVIMRMSAERKKTKMPHC